MRNLRCLRAFIGWVMVVLPVIASAVPGDTLSSIPSPCSTPTGLAWDGQYLWVADRLTDTVYAVDPVSGRLERKLPAPGYDLRAMTWDGKYLWCVDGEESRISQWDLATGLTLKNLECPVSNPQGLAWDGKDLWLADGSKNQIYRVSTEDGTTIVTYSAPSNGTTAITWWNGYLWCADRRDDKIYLFDSGHGETVFALDAPGKYARGLATDGKVLWNVDFQDDKIYRLSLDDSVAVKISDPHTLDLLLTYEFRNYGPGDVPSLDVYIAMPHDLPNQKIVSCANYSLSPKEILMDRWGQNVAHFHLENPAHGTRIQITADITAELSNARWFIYPHKVGLLKDIPKDVRDAYLVNEDKYRIADPIIQNAVKEVVGSETNPYWIMRRIHKYVREHLVYELSGGWNVAPQVLARGNGSCSEYTFVFISMCRAAGLPARYVGSVVVRGDDASSDETFHRWSQVYLPGYGWIHVDPQGGDREKPSEIAASIGQVDNRFLITTEGGGGSEYLGWGYNYDYTWTGRGPVKVFSTAIGEWSPSTFVSGGK